MMSHKKIPYLKPIIDNLSCDVQREITIIKPTAMGKSEINGMGECYQFIDQKEATKFIDNFIAPRKIQTADMIVNRGGKYEVKG